jgi:hypothetical protein
MRLKIQQLSLAAVSVVGLSLVSSSAAAEPYRQGSFRVSGGMGYVSSTAYNYVTLGGGGGYYVVDGLELGLDVNTWLGADPTVTTLTPSTTFTFFMVPQAKPYVGFFYRHWFVGDSFDDVDSWGARAGLRIPAGPAVFSIGVVYEQQFACAGSACVDVAPEFGLGFYF